MSSSSRRSLRAGRGFTLIEVLAAIVILGIGLLGIGKLMLFSVRANNSAYLRTQATNYAYEMLDLMRANVAFAEQNAYDAPFGVVANPGSCYGVACTPAQMALFDVYQWKTAMAAALPGGDGRIVTAQVAIPGSGGFLVTATVTVQYDDATAQATFNAANPNAPLQIVIETVL
jgi:type IV pilus assembly protein PilV